MIRRQDGVRGAAADDTLVLHYWNADGAVVRTVMALLLALPAVLALWLLFLGVNQLHILAGIAPSTFDDLQLVADPSTPWEVIGAVTASLTVAALFGYLVTRVLVVFWRCARGQWWLRLSATGFDVNDRLCRPHLRDGTTGPVRVGFRYLPEHRRRSRRKSDGADGYVMGWWDRPFGEAVELMNEWLARHQPAEPDASR